MTTQLAYDKASLGPCITAPGKPSPYGYHHKKKDGKKQLAHRLAYEEAYGPIPEGMFVCHKCDNRACIRLDHLFLGTPKDNIHDAINKGRIKRLKPHQREYAAAWLQRGMSQAKVAKILGVTIPAIYRIAKEHGIQPPNTIHKLTPEQRNQVALRATNGETFAAIAKSFGVSIPNVSRLARSRGAQSQFKGAPPKQKRI